MKKLLTIFFALIAFLASATDRYATPTDVVNYMASTNGQLKLNDRIIDTPFSTSGGLGQIFITNIGTVASSLPAGGTIWLDANSLPDLFSLVIHNNDVLWSNGSSKANPVKIRPLGGQIVTHMTAASNTARLWLIADIEHLEVNGFIESFPGMKYPWSGPLHGTFGFQIDAGTVLSDNPFMMMIDGPSGMKSIDIKNIEVSGGFCLFRLMPGNTDMTLDRISFTNVYGHDSKAGEGGYVMQTTGTPYAKTKVFNMRDCIWTRTAAEFLQIQHTFSDASEWSYEENFVAWGAGVNFKKPFEPFQDAGLQQVSDEGKVFIRNFIIDWVPNSAVSIINAAGGTPLYPVVFQNGLINDVGDLAVYGNSSMTHGVKHEFRNLYLRQANNTYDDKPGATVHNYFASMNGTDPNDWIATTYDNSKANLFQDVSDIDDIIGTTVDNTMPAPDYNHPPFPNRIASQYSVYTEDYEGGTKVVYPLDYIVSMDIVGTGRRYYNCILGHTSSGSTHPDTDAVHWQLIRFDEEGDASYEVDFDAGDVLTFDPWDDLRLKANSTWNLKGMGLRSNFRNTNTTTYQWFIDDDGSDAGSKAVAGQVTREFEVSSEDKGRYIRLKAYFKPSSGPEVEVWINNWTQVN